MASKSTNDPRLSVSVLSTKRTCVLSLQGDLEWSTVDTFDEVAAESVAWKPELVVLDLRSLDYLDVTGAESMSVTREQVVEYGGRAVLVNTPASAVRALELVGLGKAFAIHRIDGEQALRTVLGSATEQEPILVRALAARPRTSASSPA